MKKSVIVTLTLALTLVMAGCSADANSENHQDTFNVIADKFSDVSDHLASSFIVGHSASIQPLLKFKNLQKNLYLRESFI